jgi:hypothetical protein
MQNFIKRIITRQYVRVIREVRAIVTPTVNRSINNAFRRYIQNNSPAYQPSGVNPAGNSRSQYQVIQECLKTLLGAIIVCLTAAGLHIAQESNNLLREANDLLREANDSRRKANDSQRKANDSQRKANERIGSGEVEEEQSSGIWEYFTYKHWSSGTFDPLVEDVDNDDEISKADEESMDDLAQRMPVAPQADPSNEDRLRDLNRRLDALNDPDSTTSTSEEGEE